MVVVALDDFKRLLVAVERHKHKRWVGGKRGERGGKEGYDNVSRKKKGREKDEG